MLKTHIIPFSIKVLVISIFLFDLHIYIAMGNRKEVKWEPDYHFKTDRIANFDGFTEEDTVSDDQIVFSLLL